MMRSAYYEMAVQALRKWNEELERLQERSRRIPPDRRIEIDTQTDELRMKETFVAHMVERLRNAENETAETLVDKIRESISELGTEIRKISDNVDGR